MWSGEEVKSWTYCGVIGGVVSSGKEGCSNGRGVRFVAAEVSIGCANTTDGKNHVKTMFATDEGAGQSSFFAISFVVSLVMQTDSFFDVIVWYTQQRRWVLVYGNGFLIDHVCI